MFSSDLELNNRSPRRRGTVCKKTIGNYFVQADEQSFVCSISTRLRRILMYPIADPNSIRPHVVAVRDIEVVDPVAVGDQVTFVDAQDGSGMIVEVEPRKSQLARRAAVPKPGAHALEQVIVANLDQVVAVFSAAQPPPKWNLLDRYLASAEAQQLPALICITKIDLAGDDEELRAELELYEHLGYRVALTSAVTGEGLDELSSALQGRISVLIGKSGVGKTTLLNALQPGLGLRVNAVSAVTGKGKHTTSNLELVPLSGGGGVVDTPGMREFGLWDISGADVALLFPEMRPFVGLCRFGLDCSHDHEPGCAIRKAVIAGEISERRYQSFLRLSSE